MYEVYPCQTLRINAGKQAPTLRRRVLCEEDEEEPVGKVEVQEAYRVS
jgi:hypothetical protein